MPSSLVNLIVAFLVLLSLIFLSVTGIVNSVLDIGRIAAEVLSLPFVKVFSWVQNLFQVFTLGSQLVEENETRSQQVASLSAQLAESERFRLENRELREALGFARQTSLELIPAEIVTRDPLFQQQTAILNRGRRDGVEEDLAVVVADRVLVGLVASVFENTSIIDLITSSEVTINAQSSSGEATGVIRGEHGLGVLFDLVSQNEVIKVGDRIVTSGLGGQFPKNLLIGEISEIRSTSSELFQKATVIPAVNLRNLQFVFVVR